MNKKVVALTGSTRGRKTASEAMVDYLFKKLEDCKLAKYRAHEIYDQEEPLAEFITEAAEADTLLISSPIYVHSLPYPLTAVMEELAKKRVDKFGANKEMLAIVHSAYPQEIQRKPGYEICKRFAEKVGCKKWLGAIGFAGTVLLEGRPLEEMDWFAKWIRKSLDQVSSSIKNGVEISERAYELAEKFPPIPVILRLMKVLLNLKGKWTARKNNVKLDAQPLIKEKSK